LDDLLLKIAAAYIRVSDERQDEYSPTSQLKKIRENAAQDGYSIPDEYVFYDDGISGRNVKKRDEFNRMIATAKAKPQRFDRIYVWKFSRFARNQEQAIVYKNLLRKTGVTVKSVSEKIPDDHFGTLLERIIEWMDEFYSLNLSEEVTRGMVEKVSRGEPVCPPAFGYIIRDKKYYPDVESGAADIVREIFQRYADGEKQRAIATSLAARGVKTKYGNAPDNRFIDYILNNPLYIGKIRFSTGGIKAASKRNYASSDLMIGNGIHEPLISIELWEKVQARLNLQKQMYAKHSRINQPIDYMLKGLVRCSACGSTLAMSAAVSGKSKKRTLQCCAYNSGKCAVSHSVILENVEKALIEGLQKAINTKQFTLAPVRPKKNAEDEIDYTKLILLEERRLERAREAYLSGIDTLEQYAKNKEELLKKLDDLKRMRDAIPVKSDFNADEFAGKVIGVLSFLEDENASPTAKNEALRTIISKIVYQKADKNLAIYFNDI
jgi:DNA invertase Pin-like site-specific DNA recombinase